MTDPDVRPDPGSDDASRLLCVEFVELVSAYIDGDLPPEARARVDAHLAACHGCNAYVDQMRQTIEIAGRLTPEAVPDGAVEQLLGVFRAARRG